MEPRNLEHRRANFKGKTQFSAQEVRFAPPSPTSSRENEE